MSRRKYRKTEADYFFADVVEIGSFLPWWITLPIALSLYFFIPFNFPVGSQSFESMNVVSMLFVPLLQGGFKYLVPLVLILGAGLNIFSKIKSIFIFGSIKKNGARETVEQLSWQDFEFLLSEWFKKEGFVTELTGGGGADGGVDIKLYKDKGLHLVQCKHYKAWKVSVNVVRELYGVMTAEKAVGGYIITSGRFTKEAQAFAQDKEIELIDGTKLADILEHAPATESATAPTTPRECPKCGAQLAERKGKYGRFLGCSNYPKCKFTK